MTWEIIGGFVAAIFYDRWWKLFRALSQFGAYHIAASILIILLAIQLARIIWLVATPVKPSADWRFEQTQIMPPQQRLELFSSFDPFFRGSIAEGGTAVTSLNLVLYGIRMNEGSGLGSAILAGSDGVQESYAVGDEIMPGVKLSGVQFDHVVLDRNGILEILYMDQSIPAQTVGGENTGMMPPPVLSPSPILQNPAQAIGLNARSANGKVTGIMVSPQGDGGIFKSAGFREGDIITAVNGKPVTSADDIEALKNQVKPGSRISVTIERGTEVVPVTVNLDGQ